MNRVNNDKPCSPHQCFDAGKCDVHGCSEKACGSGQYASFHPHSCNKNAIVVKGNKQYCKIHDPKYVEAKNAERYKAYRAKWDQRDRQSEIRAQKDLIMDALKNPTMRQYLPATILEMVDNLIELEKGE